jgi:hypothetical protein
MVSKRRSRGVKGILFRSEFIQLIVDSLTTTTKTSIINKQDRNSEDNVKIGQLNERSLSFG